MLHLRAKSYLCAASAVVLACGVIATSLLRAQTRPRVTGGASAASSSTLATTARSQQPASATEQKYPRASIRQLAVLAGHAKEIAEIAFSPDGKMLATASLDNTIRLWDASTGETRAVLTLAEKQRFGGLRWSYDGRQLMAYSRRGSSNSIQVRIWDAGGKGALKATIEPHYNNYLTDYGWSPDGRVLLTASEDGTVELWDAGTGQLRKSLTQAPLRPGETKSLLRSLFSYKNYADLRLTHGYFDATGQSILTLSYNHSPKLWDAVSGKLKNTLPLTAEDPHAKYPSFPVQALFSPDRRLVVRHDEDGISLLDATTGLVKYSLGAIGKPLAFSPDGQSLLVVSSGPMILFRSGDAELKLYDIETGQLQRSFEKVPEGVNRIYWSPDGGRLVVVGGGDTKPRLLDTRTGRVRARLPYGGCTPDSFWGKGGCGSFHFSADGRIMFTQKNPLKLWNAATGELLATIEDAGGYAQFSPTNRRVLVTRGKEKKTALLWDVSIQ